MQKCALITKRPPPDDNQSCCDRFTSRPSTFQSDQKERTEMAARPTWKGFMKISLVNIPVRVFPATDAAATISFNQLHAECQTRIQQKRWCPHCEREVPDLRDRQGLRVRERPLRRHDRRRHGEGEAGVDARHRPRAVHGRVGYRSDLRRAPVLPRAGRADGARGLCRHARRDEGQGGHRQAGALRPRVPGCRAAARQGPRDVHHAACEGSPQHGQYRGARDQCRKR